MNINIELLTAGRRQVKSPTEIRLGYREIYQQSGDLRGYQIIPIEGKIWVTQQGDLDDYTLSPGERFTISCPGQVVIQGMTRNLCHRIKLLRKSKLKSIHSTRNSGIYIDEGIRR